LTGLKTNATYYYAPYVQIDKSTDRFVNGYFVPSPMEYQQFTTETAVVKPPETFKDTRDNKTYNTMTFGSAVWMIENIRYNSTTGTYTWAQALTVCPSQWHLPDDSDWGALRNILGADAEQYFPSGSHWWSTKDSYSEAYYYHYYAGRITFDTKRKESTCSVRCVKD